MGKITPYGALQSLKDIIEAPSRRRAEVLEAEEPELKPKVIDTEGERRRQGCSVHSPWHTAVVNNRKAYDNANAKYMKAHTRQQDVRTQCSNFFSRTSCSCPSPRGPTWCCTVKEYCDTTIKTADRDVELAFAERESKRLQLQQSITERNMACLRSKVGP